MKKPTSTAPPSPSGKLLVPTSDLQLPTAGRRRALYNKHNFPWKAWEPPEKHEHASGTVDYDHPFVSLNKKLETRPGSGGSGTGTGYTSVLRRARGQDTRLGDRMQVTCILAAYSRAIMVTRCWQSEPGVR